MPGTLVSDASAPVLWNGTTITTSDTDGIIQDVEVGYPGDVAVKAVFGTCDFTTTDEFLTIVIEGSNDGSTYYTLGAFEKTAAAMTGLTRWLRLHVPYRYMQALAIVEGTSPSFICTVTVHEDMYMETIGETA